MAHHSVPFDEHTVALKPKTLRMRSPEHSHTRQEGRKDGEKSGGPLVLVLIIVGVVLAIIAPILAQIIQLAVSRQREYLADATAVQLTRYPLGLANALRKIDADPHEMQNANRGTAHLYIDNPIEKFEARANSPFASHPPIQDRIRRLELLARQMSGPAVQGQA